MINGHVLNVLNVLLQLLRQATWVWVLKLPVLVGILLNVQMAQDVVVNMTCNFVSGIVDERKRKVNVNVR